MVIDTIGVNITIVIVHDTFVNVRALVVTGKSCVTVAFETTGGVGTGRVSLADVIGTFVHIVTLKA
jgi:hypothetical protein